MASSNKKDPGKSNLLLHISPLYRLLISLVLGGITLFFIPDKTTPLIKILSGWLVVEFSYLVMGWIILFSSPISNIREYARQEDGSKIYVFIMVLISSFASILIVLMLMISKAGDDSEHGMFVFVSVAGIFLSWFLVHTLYTFHYAHMYYDDAEGDNTKDAEGLNFPQDDDPDYIDFTYFSFVIGCTFQVSDVEINSRRIRHAVLAHQMISFFLNTIVVALTINLVAGLIK